MVYDLAKLLGGNMKDNAFDDVPFEPLGLIPGFQAKTTIRPTFVTGTSGTVCAPEQTRPREPKRFYRDFGKRLMDIVIVILSLPMTFPVTLFCALALFIEGGNPFYRQRRLGAGGRVFEILKLRTMCRDAEKMLESCLEADPALRAEWDLTQKLKNDPRITRVGAFLRKTSLDELPQFWNVFKGEMSVVGPRPMMPDQLSMYDNPTPYFALRPGITGAWQVSDRNESSFSYRSTVDARYHANLSIWRDMRILVQTVGVVLRRTGH